MGELPMNIEKRPPPSRIIIKPEKCTICRSCEIACSYHFKKEFNPKISQIKIIFDPKSADLRIAKEKGCDFCKNEKVPLCVKYCVRGALKAEKVE
jgi:Fe-S-cluster-containing dehydrogenase component